MTPEELVNEGQIWLGWKYPGYGLLPARERRVLAAAWLCDVKKPREKTGHNDGEVVEAIQACGHGSKGQPWCAYAQICIALVSRTWHANTGLVADWRYEAKAAKRTILLTEVQRGDLVTARYPNGTGHIGCVLKRIGPFILGIEGNTGPGTEGNQRDGQGMYRRTRLLRFWHDAMRGD